LKFWKDKWTDGLVLKENFSRLIIIFQCQNSLVGDVVD